MSNMVIEYLKLFYQEYLLSLLITLPLSFLIYKWLRQSKRLPPGPIGLPFLGYNIFLGDESYKTYNELAKKYGNIFSLKIGSKLFVILNEYTVAKEVLTQVLDRDEDFLGHVQERGFFASNGAEWLEQRRFVVQSMKDLGLGKSKWETMIQEEIRSLLEDIKSSKGHPFNITDRLYISASNNILSFIVGRRLDKVTESVTLSTVIKYLHDILDDVKLNSIVASVPQLIVLFKYLRIGNYHNMFNTINEFRNFLKVEIERHRKHSENQESDDFIELYMNKLEKSLQQSGHYFSDYNLLGNATVLFLGGSDTIAASTEWLFRIMAAFPGIQRKVHEEIDDVLGRDGTIIYNERSKLPYTFAVIMEAQRFSSIGPLSPNRYTFRDIEVDGFTIPKGTYINANLWALHRDPKYWKQPEEFNPERFLNKEKTEIVNNPPSFAPFSIGKRNCPGDKIAYMALLLFFSSVMQKFRITAPPGERIRFETYKGIIRRLLPQKLCFIERTDEDFKVRH